ncbi:MAG TPA: type II toxin-antitoxin system PemK/MazF family toxin [Pyrinomonadaceae bacterium]|nr:type II toxin-antitoxin system PemK/MazF family toxin [Pyrinomonadaceae bacterium]
MIRRGQVWRADLGAPRGASPGYERPVIVIQSDVFNKTNIDSVIVAAATTNLRLAKMPGNVRVASGIGGLREESVINITQLFTIDKEDLLEFWGHLPADTVAQIDAGLRLVLHLKNT